MNGNKFYYYHECIIDELKDKNIPKLKEGENTYIQKIYWINGKDSVTDEYIRTSVQ